REPHPERPERLLAARAGLHAALPPDRRLAVEAALPDEGLLETVHRPSYLQHLRCELRTGWGHLDPDTYFSPESSEAALRAAGGAGRLARILVNGEARAGLALLRPPGHHAEPDRAMGFCLLNNVAVAAHAALAEGL